MPKYKFPINRGFRQDEVPINQCLTCPLPGCCIGKRVALEKYRRDITKRLIEHGLTNEQITVIMGISTRTVRRAKQ